METRKISRPRSRFLDYTELQWTWSFHVVVLRRKAKKCTKIYNARAQLLVSPLTFCLKAFSLPTSSWLSYKLPSMYQFQLRPLSQAWDYYAGKILKQSFVSSVWPTVHTNLAGKWSFFIRKRYTHDNLWFPWSGFLQTQIKNDRWLLRF